MFICVCSSLCTIVAHNTAQNRPDNFPSCPPDNHHCSDDVYLREGGVADYISFHCCLSASLYSNSSRCLYRVAADRGVPKGYKGIYAPKIAKIGLNISDNFRWQLTVVITLLLMQNMLLIYSVANCQMYIHLYSPQTVAQQEKKRIKKATA